MFLYRKFQGREMFMGIMLHQNDPSTFVKLNDYNFIPDNWQTLEDMREHGHVMSDDEFYFESSHYDGFGGNPDEIYKKVPFFDFSTIPPGHPDSCDADVNHKYPLWGKFWGPGGAPPKVRAGDSVRVWAYVEVPGLPFPIREKFWVDVICVTTTGLVSGASMANLNWFDCKVGDTVQFPLTSVMSVKHGENW